MVFNRLAPINYITFEDSHMMELVSYHYGDVETITNNTIASGSIDGNSDTAIEEVLFADNLPIPAHNLANGSSFTAKGARAVNYRLYVDTLWEIDSAIVSSGYNVFSVSYLPHKSLSWTVLASVAGNIWESESTDKTVFDYDETSGKWYADFTAPNTCRYIKLIFRAASGESVNWELFVKSDSTVYKPIGITTTQCASVTQFPANASPQTDWFTYNPFITKFNEFVYFTSFTSIAGNQSMGRSGGFYDDRNLSEITFPNSLTVLGERSLYNAPIISVNAENITSIARRSFYNSALTSLVLPSIVSIGTNSITSNSLLRYVELGENVTTLNTNFGSVVTIVCRATTPPTFVSGFNFAALYVPSDSLDTYKSTSNISDKASKIYAIEGTWYENNHSLDPNA